MNHKTDSARALTTEQLAEKALAATVYIEIKDSTGTTLSFGSGFYVKPNQIATNFHVIEGAALGTAKLVGKDTRYQIEGTVATDKDNDLAVLSVTASGVTPLPLGDSDTVNTGAQVYVAGNPKGLEGTFSDGLISRREKNQIQMTAPVSPGSSGGPVLNSKGEVIGISVAVHRGLDAQNLNFAIQSNYLKALLAKVPPVKPLPGSQSISAETYCSLGDEKYELGLYHEAIADYDKAICLDPDDAGAYNNRGAAKASLKQYFAAVADYTQAIRLKPDFAHAYIFRGNAKADLKQYAAAIADYDMAIRLKPDYAFAYNNRGLAKRKLKQYAAAIVDYDTAIRLKPDFAHAYNNRGFAKYNLEQYAAAIVDYDTAIRLSPDFVRAYHNRGIAKALLGRTREAKQDFRTALRLAEKAGDADLKAHIEETLRLLE